MANLHKSHCVIFNADDFGHSTSINAAVIRAHREGVLTTASLMVNGEAFEEAVALAKETPTLGVGLHLTLVLGRATLPPEKIPGLVNAHGAFADNPVATGAKYVFSRALRPQLEAEIVAQIEKFRATGLTMDHLNGHLHFHLHPAVFEILTRRQSDWKIPAMRLPRDPFKLSARTTRGHWLCRLSHAIIFHFLCWRAQPSLRRLGIIHADRVFGLLQHARVTEDYLLRLLSVLPAGVSEVYSHPCLKMFPDEFAALISVRVIERMKTLGIQRCRYSDLSPGLRQVGDEVRS